jgi:LEA14-like dessication related protein
MLICCLNSLALKPLLFLVLVVLLPADLFKEPDFIDARNFRLAAIGLKSSTVKTDLVYFNPNNFGLNLKTAELDVYLNNRYAGHSLLDTLVHVPARDTFFVPVSVQVDMKNVFPNALTILMSDSIDLRVEGKMKVGKAGIYVNVPVRYQEKHSIRKTLP